MVGKCSHPGCTKQAASCDASDARTRETRLCAIHREQHKGTGKDKGRSNNRRRFTNLPGCPTHPSFGGSGTNESDANNHHHADVRQAVVPGKKTRSCGHPTCDKLASYGLEGKRKKSVPSAVAAGAVAKAKSKYRSLVKDFHLSLLAAGKRFCCECRECSNRVNPKPTRKKVVKASAGSLVGKKANKSYGRGKKVGFACRCSVCSEVGGVVMCFECYSDRDKHASAFESAKNSAKRRPVFQWGSKSSPV